ncbi:lysozyme inhibitor LprI family protein [Pseudomonas aeruginosa]|uniref:lysozyme inhibitor LprI family protein n=1 Tax=Pseudomonas aeruginosa TaxID=287 RepID=UPI00070EEA5F|nr:lysozyme inhibitor LprI family protein [Pseudomonas aeruginosa]
MQLRAAASGLLLALLAGQTVAASFDCSKASSFPEKEICRDGYLSGLDDWLAKSYRTALEVNPDQYEAVRQSQREWLATRDACTDQKCLDKTIGARIQALDQYVTGDSTRTWTPIPRTLGQ